MQSKILKTGVSEYQRIEWNGANESGAKPVGDYILVMPDLASEQTAGGVFIDARTVERHALAAETGILIECGGDAFVWNADRTRQWDGAKPKPGDRVYFTRYAGQLLHGDDGRTYRVMEDKNIGALKA